MPKKDLNQLAYSILRQATGEEPNPKNDESAKVKAGRSGGLKGGVIRATKLTPERRAEIGKKAAEARWRKSS
jgi:general stress protein YciG